MSKYNVLLLMTDQHRFDANGFMGNKEIQTPNLDRLASEGTVFTNAYTECPSCVPARAALLTGMTPWHLGILGMGRALQPEMGVGFEHTLPGELTQNGYDTMGVGKMHFFPQRSLNGFSRIVLDESLRRQDIEFKSDYEVWFDEHKDGNYGISEGRNWNGWEGRPYDNPDFLHPTNWTSAEAIKFIEQRNTEMPFFLKVSFARPHSPYDAIEEYFSMYRNRDLPEAKVGNWAKIFDRPEIAKQQDGWCGVRSPQEIHDARAGYYGNITHIDHEIGRLFDKMEKSDLLDNTLVIFTSDHGDMLGDQNLWRKTYAYEGSTHIPMIVRLPRELRDRCVNQSDKVVMLRDIMPTVLETVGLSIPDTVEGLSMLPLVQNKECQWREYGHGEHSLGCCEFQEMHYLTDGKIKYIWLSRVNQEQLFDLENDPYELYDLSQKAEFLDCLQLWRKRMAAELEPRDCGLVKNGELISQAGKAPVISPFFGKRMREGATSQELETIRQITGADYSYWPPYRPPKRWAPKAW